MENGHIYRQGQRTRVFLFYLSVFIFVAGLPLILSYALGYKFDSRNMRFVKVGLIVLKTQPEGAEVYVDGRFLKEKTPLSINELLPGKYSLEMKLRDYYPWKANVIVEAGKVIRFEDILFFPLRSHIEQLNREVTSSFYLDEDKNTVYYFDKDKGMIYKSGLDGDAFERFTRFFPLEPPALRYKFSPDRQKLAYFNRRSIAVSFLNTEPETSVTKEPLVFNINAKDVRDIFWYSNNYYLIVLTAKTIEILEIRPEAEPVVLVSLSQKDGEAFYDTGTDTLYFQDIQKAEDGNLYENVYMLKLGGKISDIPKLREFLKQKNNESK